MFLIDIDLTDEDEVDSELKSTSFEIPYLNRTTPAASPFNADNMSLLRSAVDNFVVSSSDLYV